MKAKVNGIHFYLETDENNKFQTDGAGLLILKFSNKNLIPYHGVFREFRVSDPAVVAIRKELPDGASGTVDFHIPARKSPWTCRAPKSGGIDIGSWAPVTPGHCIIEASTEVQHSGSSFPTGLALPRTEVKVK